MFLTLLAVAIASSQQNSSIRAGLQSCQSGTVTRVNYLGYDYNGKNPSIAVYIQNENSPANLVVIGLTNKDEKKIVNIANMQSMLMGAMLAGAPVEILTTKGDCSNLSEADVEVDVSVPIPGTTSGFAQEAN